MFTCPSGDVFIGSIDTTREWKDAHYVCNALGGYIKTIGVNNIVQICIDNVSSMRSASDLLIRHFPSLYFQGYATQMLSRLIIGRLGKNNMGKMNCEKCKSFCFFHITTPCTTINLSSL
jgi:hypothetical protein